MVQNLPADQPFDSSGFIASANAHHQFETGYLSWAPFADIGSGGSGSSSPTIATQGYLSDAQKVVGADYIECLGVRDGSGPSVGDSSLRAFVWTDEDAVAQTDTSTTVVFRLDQSGVANVSTDPTRSGQNTPTFEPDSSLLIDPEDSSTTRSLGAPTPGSIRRSTAGSFGNQTPVPFAEGAGIHAFLGVGVAVRVKGATYGTTVSSGTPESAYAKRQDHYFLWVYPFSDSTTSDLIVVLLSVYFTAASSTGGRLRELARHVIPAGTAGLDLTAPLTVQVDIDDVSTNPTIDAYIGPFTTPSGTVYQTTQVFTTAILGGTVTSVDANASVSSGTVTDTDANRIQGSGSIGFALARERRKDLGQGLTPIRSGVVLVDVTRSGGTPLFRDEFQRVGFNGQELSQLGGVDIIRGVLGTNGAWFNGLWSMGATANLANTRDHVQNLVSLADASTFAALGYASLDHDSTAPPGTGTLSGRDRDYYSFRPSDYASSHHRSFEFQMPVQNPSVTGGYVSQTYWFGVAVRGSALGGAIQDALVGYAFVSTDGTTGAQTALSLYVARRQHATADSTATYTVIASKTIHSSGTPPAGFDLFDGAWHTLDLDVYPQNVQNTLGPAVYKLSLDGTQVVLDTVGQVSGVTLESDGTVLDSAPLVQSGRVEGIFFASSNGETNASGNAMWDPPKVRNWTQGSLTVSGLAIDPDSMATISIADEGASSATGNLETVISHTFKLTTDYQRALLSHRFDSGHRYSSPRWGRGRRTWTFTNPGTTQTELDALLAFWDSHDGATTPFNWTPDVEETAVVAVFWEPSLKVREVSQGVYDVRFSIVEVLA